MRSKDVDFVVFTEAVFDYSEDFVSWLGDVAFVVVADVVCHGLVCVFSLKERTCFGSGDL